MTMLLHSLLCFVLTLAHTPTAGSKDAVPLLPMPDLNLAALVTVTGIDGTDGITVKRQDNSYLPVRLAGVLADQQDAIRRQPAMDFLHNLLAGEKVWIVHADASKSASQDCYYVYRWPDRLLVNLEMVRQGYTDITLDKTAPPPVVKAFTYWRDQARLQQRGRWSEGTRTLASRPTGTAPAPATQAVAAVTPQPTAPPVQPVVQTVADRTIVYVTPSGKKYHTANCRSLRSTRTPITLEEARKKYEPCKQCNPPK